MEYGIVGFIVLVLNIYALVKIWTSGATGGSKIIWTLLILILPVIGFIIWFFAGPKGSSHAAV